MEESSFLSRRRNVTLLAILCCFLWGSATPVIKIGYEQWNVAGLPSLLLFAGIRFSLAGMLTILLGSLTEKHFLRPKKTSWGMVFRLCIFQTVMQYVCYYIGLQHITAVKGTILNTTAVFLCMLLAAAFRQERLTAGKILGCLVGFIGVITVNLSPDAFSGGIQLLGEGMIFLNCLAYAVSSVLLKEYSRYENPVTLSGYQFLAGGVLVTLTGLALGGRVEPQSLLAFPVLGYLCTLSAVAYSVWGLLLRHNPVSRIAIFGFLNPIVGVMLSALLLQESRSVSWGQCLAALGMVSTGIFIINRPSKM